MLSDVCAEIKNYFTYEGDKHFGDFTIEGGEIVPHFDFPTNYVRIMGSHLNNGVHVLTNGEFTDLVDEPEFHGAIWIMSPPKDFLDLVEEIKAWQTKYGSADSTLMSPFQSESFGGYSYSKASGGGSSNGKSTVPTWESMYATKLNRYRRIREN